MSNSLCALILREDQLHGEKNNYIIKPRQSEISPEWIKSAKGKCKYALIVVVVHINANCF